MNSGPFLKILNDTGIQVLEFDERDYIKTPIFCIVYAHCRAIFWNL